MGAAYFDARVAPRLWRDESDPLDLAEALRRFAQWTYLPILPDREAALTGCVREGISMGRWAVAVGDVATAATATYRDLIETTDAFDRLGTLFDGTAALVRGELRQLIREEVHLDAASRDEGRGADGPAPSGVGTAGARGEGTPEAPSPIPPPSRRLARIRLCVPDLAVAKTNNLQPYLFRVLQEQDAGAAVSVTIEVSSAAGISRDALDGRIVEGFGQLGIAVTWEEE